MMLFIYRTVGETKAGTPIFVQNSLGVIDRARLGNRLRLFLASVHSHLCTTAELKHGDITWTHCTRQIERGAI